MSGSAGHHLKPRTMLRISILIVLPMLHASVIATEEDFRCKEPFSKCVTSTKVFTMKVEPMLFNEDFSGNVLETLFVETELSHVFDAIFKIRFYGTPPPTSQ